ncbi:MAG: DUF551 domain-containing protein [Motiliproteus sp.]|nr:DUF551 domain-containing protein [Motiliproteus sp.]MCW9051277.1 DUF551 domain-containing protein [Motiliproteus sp.]
MSKWVSVKDQLPEPEKKVLILNSEGMEVAHWQEGAPDQPDEMGYDAGFIGELAFPSRSIGAPSYMYEENFQPTHWMPLPEPPTE